MHTCQRHKVKPLLGPPPPPHDKKNVPLRNDSRRSSDGKSLRWRNTIINYSTLKIFTRPFATAVASEAGGFFPLSTYLACHSQNCPPSGIQGVSLAWQNCGSFFHTHLILILRGCFQRCAVTYLSCCYASMKTYCPNFQAEKCPIQADSLSQEGFGHFRIGGRSSLASTLLHPDHFPSHDTQDAKSLL